MKLFEEKQHKESYETIRSEMNGVVLLSLTTSDESTLLPSRAKPILGPVHISITTGNFRYPDEENQIDIRG